VLAREEKFASSELPDLLNSALHLTKTIRVFWTGRIQHPEIEQRLHKGLNSRAESPCEFVGWVSPEKFLNFIDILIDTPNLGGLVAYWAMSINKVVISATEMGSIGALASPELLSQYFEYLEDEVSIDAYFSSTPSRPFYLADAKLIPHCIFKVEQNLEQIDSLGKLFGNFFRDHLNNFKNSSEATFAFLSGTQPEGFRFSPS
jgi:hypothetical protein